MTGTVPLELLRLLTGDAGDTESAWDALMRRHARLLLSVAHSLGKDRDRAMDYYAYILEKLREDDYRRLRAFRDDRGATFATWLAVTARRLCLDHHRAVYGRAAPDAAEPVSRGVRRAIADLRVVDLDPDEIADRQGSQQSETESRERTAILHRALAALPARDQLLIALRFRDGLSAARIAQVMAFATPFHVYRQLGRVLHTLRETLESGGVDSAST